MTFQLDTTGDVRLPATDFQAHRLSVFMTFASLPPFTQGYIEALFAAGLWGQSCKPCAGNGEIVTDWDRYLGAPEPGDQGDEGTADCPNCDGLGAHAVGFSDLAPETLARIIADCEAFQASPAHDHGGDRKAKGAAFWKARNAVPDLGSSRYRFPPLTVQLGDDGKVRFA